MQSVCPLPGHFSFLSFGFGTQLGGGYDSSCCRRLTSSSKVLYSLICTSPLSDVCSPRCKGKLDGAAAIIHKSLILQSLNVSCEGNAEHWSKVAECLKVSAVSSLLWLFACAVAECLAFFSSSRQQPDAEQTEALRKRSRRELHHVKGR